MAVRQALQHAWLRRGPLASLLLPLSLLYGALSALHRAGYRTGLLRTERLPVPVIVVGNVVAGGAGKTPVVLAVLAQPTPTSASRRTIERARRIRCGGGYHEPLRGPGLIVTSQK